MPILAISLAPDMIHSFSRRQDIELCCTNCVEQALELLANREFRVVIEDTRRQPEADQDLARLLAATTPGTPIIALATPVFIPDSHYWQAQGITLLYQPPRLEEINRIVEINR